MTEAVPPPDDQPPGRDPSWYDRPWMLVTITIAALAVVILAVVLLRGLGEPDEVVVADTPTPTATGVLPSPPTPAVTPTTPSPTATETVATATPTTPPPSPPPTVTVTAPPLPPAVETAPGPQPVQLAGEGGAVTEGVEIEGGLVVMRLAHRGDGPFEVRVLSESRAEIQVLVQADGDYRGSRAIGLDAGTYHLDVTAGGVWGISVEQPRYTRAPHLPRTLEGTDGTATEPFTVDGGEIRFQWENTDGVAMDVRVLNAEGGIEAQFTAEPAGAGTVLLEAGVYLLDVVTDGIWRVIVS